MPRDIDVLPDFEPGRIEVAPIPKFLYRGNLAEELKKDLSREQAVLVLRHMLEIRHFEERIIELKGGKFEPLKGFKFVGATHLSIGQEGVGVGGISAIGPDDYITSTHRGHGHGIAKGAFWIEAQDEEGLRKFIGDGAKGTTREELLREALQTHLHRTMAELLGKEDGYCRGRGGGMHIADFNMGHLGANAIVGGSYAMATGAAIACDKLGNGRVVLCFMGDGALSNGISHEAQNMATMAQFKRGCPVIYLVENNQYGMTGQQAGEVTGIRYLAQRGAAYNDVSMNAEVVNGMDVLAVRDAVRRAAEKCRSGKGPVLLEALTYRYMGHSLSDNGTAYRSKEEEEAWKAQDAIERYTRQIIENGLMTEDEVEALARQVQEAIDAATLSAAAAEAPEPSTIMEGLFANTTSDDIGDKWRTPDEGVAKPWRKMKRDSAGRILCRHAVAEALAEEMMRDRRVILYGEDVADYGGAFQVTRGLLDTFGRERVFNTAISEAAIVGSAVGAAQVGLRPVAEIMYIDFILQTMDQTGNQAAKNRYMFGGKATIPMVIRTTIGGGKGYAGQHSQSLEAVVTMIPGLKVVIPSNAYDAKGLLKTAIRDDNPVIFIEHQLLYIEKGECPEDEYTVPFGAANVLREGKDLTIVAYGYMVPQALESAEQVAAEDGIECEIIDPRTLCPLDVDTIAESVSKTGRLLCLSQAPATGCFSEHIVYAAQERCFADMKKPAKIVAAYDVPPPMATPLEQENIPSPRRIVPAIRELMA